MQDPLSDLLSPSALAAAQEPLSRAATLPAEAFRSPAIYEREVERLFRGGWLCAGRLDQVPEPGDYRCLDLLGDKLMVVRDRADAVRVLSRVCRHRGAELVDGVGNTRSFQCPYHAWTFRLDGQLQGAPFMEEAEDFERASCRLPELRSEVWEGWIFVNPSGDAPSLAPQLAPLSALLARYHMGEMVSVPTAEFESPFGWKVLVDNFMEAYHHIATHRDTLESVYPARCASTPEPAGPYSLLAMPRGDGDREREPGPFATLPRVGPLDPAEASQLLAGCVFPFHLFACSPEMLTWYQLFPERVDHFRLQIYSCFPRETLDTPVHAEAVAGLQELVRVVHHQDIAACEATWAGLGAPSYEAGRLAPLEGALWHFNQWWIDRMTDNRPTP